MTSNNEKKISNNIYNEILKKKVIEDYDLTSSIFKGFIFIGIITKILFSISDINDVENGSYGPASITLWSYGIIIFSFIVIMFLNMLNNDQQSFNVLKDFNSIVLIILLLWIISFNRKHFKKINSLKIPENYWNYEKFSTVIIIIHVCFYIYNMGENQNSDMKEKIEFIIWFLVFLNFFLILIQQIILDSFTVDIL